MPTAVPVSLPLLAVLLLATAAFAVLGLSAQARRRSRQFVVDYGVFAVFALFAVAGIWLFLDPRFGEENLRALLQEYGLAALFGIFVLEGAMLLYFAPSESVVPAAFWVAQNTDVAPAENWVLAVIIATSVVGATIGQYLLFLLAKRWGRERLLERPWFRISDEQLAKFEAWFDRWGVVAVPVSNSLLFTRGMLTVPAGLAEMSDRKFVLLSALGTLSFELLLAAAYMGVVELGIL